MFVLVITFVLSGTGKCICCGRNFSVWELFLIKLWVCVCLLSSSGWSVENWLYLISIWLPPVGFELLPPSAVLLCDLPSCSCCPSQHLWYWQRRGKWHQTAPPPSICLKQQGGTSCTLGPRNLAPYVCDSFSHVHIKWFSLVLALFSPASHCLVP